MSGWLKRHVLPNAFDVVSASAEPAWFLGNHGLKSEGEMGNVKQVRKPGQRQLKSRKKGCKPTHLFDDHGLTNEGEGGVTKRVRKPGPLQPESRKKCNETNEPIPSIRGARTPKRSHRSWR